MKNDDILFADFCSGIGAGRLGLEQAGMKCIVHSEINKDSESTYNLFFGKEKNLGDLTEINPSSIKGVDVLIAGFPCQTFSIAGKRAGFEDERGQIIFYLKNILIKSDVPYFIFENVKGLVNHNGGKTIKRIIDTLDEAGYKVYYKILCSADFGVPQLRERVYIVGIKKGLSDKPFLFPYCKVSNKIENFLIPSKENEFDISNLVFQKYINNKYNKGRISIDELLKKDYLVIDTRQSDLRVYDRIFPTLRTGRHGILYVKGGKLYKLTGKESLLLQGFTKDKAEKAVDISDTLLLSQTGNAMTVNVIKAIGENLIKIIKTGYANGFDKVGLSNS